MFTTCKKTFFLLSFISSFCVILVWSGSLLPLDYVFLRSAYSASALTPTWWLYIHLYCLGQPYIPQQLLVYWVFYVMEVVRWKYVDILLNWLSYILFHRSITQERTRVCFTFCAALGYFSQGFEQRKRNLLKRRLSPLWGRWLIAWGLRFFGGRKERE